MQKISLLFFIIFFLFCHGQDASKKKIDAPLNAAKKAFAELKFEESLRNAQVALGLAVRADNSYGRTSANISIAKVLLETGFYKDGLSYLEKVEKEQYYLNSSILKAECSRLRGRAYANLKMFDQAVEEFNQQIRYSENIEDPNKKVISKLWAHQNLAHTYDLKNERDSVWIHLIKAEKILTKLKEEESFYDLSSTYALIGNEYIKKKQFVKARVYLDKSMALLRKYEAPYLYFTLEKYGDLADAEGSTESAIYYYEQALENTIKLKNTDASRDSYKVLADYLLAHNIHKEKAKEYLYQSKILSDSLDNKNRYATEMAIKSLLDKNKTKQDDVEINYTLIIIVLLIFSGIGFSYMYSNMKKWKFFSQIDQKIIEQQQNLTEELSQKVATTKFNDLISLAKNNNPEFLILFKELFPDFIAQLKFLSPDIKSSELSFCAMTYLNFSTKDIAEYTFVTTRAVQIRKNRLRKKYNIPSEQDFNSWMRKLVSTKNDFIDHPNLSEE